MNAQKHCFLLTKILPIIREIYCRYSLKLFSSPTVTSFRQFAIAVVLMVTPANFVLAQSGTLFQWVGSNETGGPPSFDEPLASDRPDFTEASTTVGRNVCQLEMGYTYFNDDGEISGMATHSFPDALFRIGVLNDWLELRLGINSGSTPVVVGPNLSQQIYGFEDLYLGVKLGLTSQAGVLPEMALIPQTTIPTGTSEFTAGQVLPGLNWLYGWDINDWLSTAGSTQMNMALDSTSNTQFFEFAQSWTIGYSINNRLGAYTEWFMLTPVGAESVQTEHYLDGGFTYRVTNNLQLDARLGKGISIAAQDYFMGTGIVVRW